MIGYPLLPRATTRLGLESSGELVHTSRPTLFLSAPPPFVVRLLACGRIVEAGLASGVVARDRGAICVVVDLRASHRSRGRVRQVRIGMPVLPMPFPVCRIALEGTLAGRGLPRLVRPRVVSIPLGSSRRRGCRCHSWWIPGRAPARARTTTPGIRSRAPSASGSPPRAGRTACRCRHARIQPTSPVRAETQVAEVHEQDRRGREEAAPDRVEEALPVVLRGDILEVLPRG